MYRTRDNPIYSLIVVWVLLIPMLYFTARGSFSFDRPGTNNQFAVDMGSMSGAWNGGTIYFQGQQLIMYGVLCIIMVPLLARCIRRLSFRSSIALVSLPALALASILWSQSAVKTAISAAAILLLTCFSVYLIEWLSPIRQMQFFHLVGIVTLVASLLLVLFYPAAAVANFGDKGAWQGLFIHKNHCAIVMTYLVAPALCMKTRSQLGKIGKTTYVLGAIILIYMTRSRTGWLLIVATILFITVSFALIRFRAKERAIFLSVTCGALLVVSMFAIYDFAQLSLLLGKSATMSGRTEIWRAILPVLSSRPFLGYGFRAFWLGMQGPSGTIALTAGYVGLANAENSILQMWLEMGGLGVILMLVMLFISVKNALRCIVAAPSAYVIWCSVNVFLTVLALLDGDKIMYPNSVQWILYVVSYLALAQQARQQQIVGQAGAAACPLGHGALSANVINSTNSAADGKAYAVR